MSASLFFLPIDRVKLAGRNDRRPKNLPGVIFRRAQPELAVERDTYLNRRRGVQTRLCRLAEKKSLLLPEKDLPAPIRILILLSCRKRKTQSLKSKKINIKIISMCFYVSRSGRFKKVFNI